ncbi:Restriction enzyme adenine methylase associated [actinobacterium SCGC AAA044-D11]
MKNLIKVGAVQAGGILVWNRKNQGIIEELTVDSNGKLKSIYGKIHGSPTAVAKNFNGGVAINGWRVWRIKRTSEALDDLD